jgi:hypothetical protein
LEVGDAKFDNFAAKFKTWMMEQECQGHCFSDCADNLQNKLTQRLLDLNAEISEDDGLKFAVPSLKRSKFSLFDDSTTPEFREMKTHKKASANTHPENSNVENILKLMQKFMDHEVEQV